MGKKLDTIWYADPHTIAKIEILRSYIDAWFPILAISSPQPILYVDGFSGPGKYLNHPTGSPIAALEALRDSIQTNSPKIRTSGVTCAFIESDKKRFEVLNNTLESWQHPKISLWQRKTEFVSGIAELKQQFPRHFKGDDPLLVFADPFGGTDTPLTTFADCMAGGKSELLINLDADGIARIYDGKNNNYEDQLDDIFGGSCWRTELGSGEMTLREKASRILHLYKRRLREVLGVKFIFEFEMRGRKDGLNYYLVFATNHPLGMERMKEAMSKVDQNGRYCFSDADEDQIFLFSDEANKDYALQVRDHFLNQDVPFEEVERYCLCETPAKTAGSLLRQLESKDQIQVTLVPDGTRRRGSFKKEVIKSILFTKSLDQTKLFD